MPAMSVAEHDERRAEVSTRIVAVIDHQGVGSQHLMDAGPLHADAAAVYQADLAQATRMGGLQIRLDHRRHVAWRECVQIELFVDRHVMRGVVVLVVHGR